MLDVLDNMVDTFFIAIFRDLVLFSCIIISWLYWRKQVSKREYFIADLQTNLKDQNANLSDSEKRLIEQESELESLNTRLSQGEEAIRSLTEQVDEKENFINHLELSAANLEKKNKDLTTRAEEAEARVEDLKKRMQEQETKIKSSTTQLSQREGTIRGLTVAMKEKDDSINMYKEAVTDLEKRYQNLITRAEDAEAREEDLKKRSEVQNSKIESLDTRMSQREETIRGLTVQITEKDNAINLFKESIADLEKRNQDSMTHAEHAEARVKELEQSIEEKEKEITALIARERAMQDDFSYIAGIGPKVSAILRSAGINTFAKLAATNVNRIKEILKAENPNLLRLTDSTTWPEQARMAAEGEWEALSALQKSLKGGRQD
jgi:chromosome segregation ATPase